MLAPVSLSQRLRILAAQALRHPSWAVGHVSNVIEQMRPEEISSCTYVPLDLSEALKRVFPEDAARCEQILAAVPTYPPASIARDQRGASPPLAQACYALVLLCRPQSLVEIGVAEGVTSFYLLTGLKAVGGGHLTSIDLPGLTPEWQRETGRSVPAELHARWSLVLGPSSFKLPRVLKGLGEIDLAVHDGTHHAAAQIREYQLLWRHLKPGGILLSDDVDNGAFAKFATSTGTDSFAIIQQPQKNGLFGLIRKPLSSAHS
ncbi:MAG: class I SAM-dependent methyltransferase [Nitrososphaera sp.]|nr:class I SAM-dependent methyltransferase [Nitrososphaera sp.]